jgi:hypothetical protein
MERASRRFRLQVVAWLFVLGAAANVEALNNTLNTARQGTVGKEESQALAAGEVAYFGYFLYPNRSYAIWCSPATFESSFAAGNFCAVDLRDTADAVILSTAATVQLVTGTEPWPKGGQVLVFTPPGPFDDTQPYFARVSTASGGAQTFRLMVIETTLSSAWWFVSPASGYDSYVTIRNSTNGTRSVTVRAYNSAGALAGSTTVSVAANGNTLISVGGDLGVPAGTGSVTITHNGLPGSIVANTTTLSGMTGLSFDAPFSPRMNWSMH